MDKRTRALELIEKAQTLKYPESFERVCMNRRTSDNNYKARLLFVATTLYVKSA